MRLVGLVIAVLSLGVARADLPFTETNYEGGMPTLQQVIGHRNGEEITTPSEAIRYLEALEAAAPDRMRIFQYAESWEGRPLVYAVIGSPGNMTRIEAIKRDLDRLADGRSVPERDRARMIRELPAVTWLSYGVHGNEISSTDAALALAYHLLAAEDDPRVDAILENTLVVIDPMQNPDGRARFVSTFEAARGIEPQSDRFSAERDEPWPGGRFNHALFDMNRDWFALTQPETRGKVAAIAEWHPVVVVDAHEMGSDETYFFPPAARPFNPQLTESSRKGQEIIGRANAEAFDREGILYFTREVYDNFYPGFGDMWPALRGAVAMTYEQASARGLVGDRPAGQTITYGEGVRNHFIATLTTAATVAANRQRFLEAYVNDRASAVTGNEAATDRFTLVDLAFRPGQALAMGQKLADQDIEVQMLAAGETACGAVYPAGAVVIDRAQPAGRLVRTLLDPDTPLAADFIKEQEDRRKRGLGHELYDVTAWSMPLMDGVKAVTCGRIDRADLRAFDPSAMLAEALAETDYAYAVPWDDAGQARLVVAALRDGLRGRVTETAFTQDGRTFPRGTVIFTLAANGADLGERLGALVERHGGRAVAMPSGWVEDGPNPGSADFRDLTMPRVAMAWGEGTSPLSVGAARYVLEQRLGIPVTPIRVMSMGRADLDRYDVLVLPEVNGAFGDLLGRRGASAVRDFARDGGVVVGFGSALSALSSEDLGLLALRREKAVSKGAAKPENGEGTMVAGMELWSEQDYREATASADDLPDRVPGVLLRTVANGDHWLSSGYEDATVLFRGNTIYAPLREGEGSNVFSYRGADEILASGYLWDDVRGQLGRKPFLVSSNVGDGLAIGFAQDPTVRGYLGGLDLMLANAVVLAPAHTD